jgi:hypothetical protein
MLHLIRVFLLYGADDRFSVDRAHLFKGGFCIFKIGHLKLQLFMIGNLKDPSQKFDMRILEGWQVI